jgi:hypothetical protein
MKWKLEYCDSTEEGFLRTVYIFPSVYLALFTQDSSGNIIDMEIIKLYKE